MSPRNEEQNAAIKDERREQILSAALRLFAKRGFAATKISDVVEKAGMSHGLVYHYFKSKEEIFYELLKRAMQTSGESLLMAEGVQARPIEKVRNIARYILGGIENFEDSAYYFMIAAHASVMEGPSGNEKIMEGSMVPVWSMVRILKAGQEAGEIREGDPMGMGMAFFAAIQGLAQFKLAIGNFKMPDPEILVNMVKKP